MSEPETIKKLMHEGEIFLSEQEDGNWKGWRLRDGKHIEVRQINPETVLGLLLTHE